MEVDYLIICVTFYKLTQVGLSLMVFCGFIRVVWVELLDLPALGLRRLISSDKLID